MAEAELIGGSGVELFIGVHEMKATGGRRSGCKGMVVAAALLLPLTAWADPVVSTS